MKNCKGKTASGDRCKRKGSDNGYCWMHNPDKIDHAKAAESFRPKEMDANGKMSAAAFARLLKSSNQAIYSYKQRGLLSVDDDNLVDVAKSLKLINERGHANHPSTTRRTVKSLGGGKVQVVEPEGIKSKDDGLNLNTQKLAAQVDGLIQKARLHTMKADQQAGTLVERTVVDRQMFGAFRVARGQLFNIADRCASELAGMDSPPEIHKRLTDEIRDVLTELATEIETMDFSDDD